MRFFMTRFLSTTYTWRAIYGLNATVWVAIFQAGLIVSYTIAKQSAPTLLLMAALVGVLCVSAAAFITHAWIYPSMKRWLLDKAFTPAFTWVRRIVNAAIAVALLVGCLLTDGVTILFAVGIWLLGASLFLVAHTSGRMLGAKLNAARSLKKEGQS